MPVAPSNADRVRQRLADLGRQRAQHSAAGEELAEEIRKAVADARANNVPLAEAARLLGLDRSHLYRTYLHERA
jgi:transcriptional regulator of acetoin/glycerol metabolism